MVLVLEQAMDSPQVQNQWEPLFLFYLNILLVLMGQLSFHLMVFDEFMS